MKRAIVALALLAAAPESDVVEDWHTNITKDAMTDAPNAQSIIITKEGALSFLCDKKSAIVMVQPNEFLGGNMDRYDLRDTWVRFDDGQPQLSNWKYHDKYATAYNDKETLAFVTGMVQAKNVKIRLTSFDRSFIDVSFPLDKARDEVHRAYEACAS